MHFIWIEQEKQAYPLETDEDFEIAHEVMGYYKIEQLDVWSGDPDGDAVVTTSQLFN